MNKHSYTCGIALSLIISACESSDQNTSNYMEVPVAEKKIERLVAHGETRLDPYFWMNQREDQKVIDHLNKENAYREQIMSGTVALQETLFEEIKGRIKEDDRSVLTVWTDTTIIRVSRPDRNIRCIAGKKGAWKPKRRSCST